jgi:hypothetical protein
LWTFWRRGEHFTAAGIRSPDHAACNVVAVLTSAKCQRRSVVVGCWLALSGSLLHVFNPLMCCRHHLTALISNFHCIANVIFPGVWVLCADVSENSILDGITQKKEYKII